MRSMLSAQFRFFVFGLLLCLTSPSWASAPSEAQIAAFATHRDWLDLSSYQASKKSPSGYRSDIENEEYFLVSGGRNDPEAELRGTLQAMAMPMGEDADAHARCRFPARRLLLIRAGLMSDDGEAVRCPLFEQWKGAEPIRAASIVFASGNFSNPASFFGHILLRFKTDATSSMVKDSVAGPSINYGAVYPDQENGFLYITRGLSGGYLGAYSKTPFFQYMQENNEESARDIWEYDLNLTADQLDMLLALTFESMGAHQKYYYLKQNCGFRIARLIEYVTGSQLIRSNKPWVVPADLLGTLSDAKAADGTSLVSSVHKLNSDQSRFRKAFAKLTDAEKAAVRRFVDDTAMTPQQLLAPLDAASGLRVLNVLIRYYEMDETGEDAPRKLALVGARMQLPPDAPEQPDTAPQGQPPHIGQGSTMVEVSTLYNNDKQWGGQIRVRAAYNDFLSQTAGAQPFSELTALDGRFNIIGGKFYVRSFDIMRITALRLSPTGLKRDGGKAWQVYIGLDQERLACKACAVPMFQFGVGKAAYVGPNAATYFLVYGRLSGPGADYDNVNFGVKGGLIFAPQSPVRFQLSVDARQDVFGDGKPVFDGNAEVRWRLSKQMELGGSVAVQRWRGEFDKEARVGLSYYW